MPASKVTVLGPDWVNALVGEWGQVTRAQRVTHTHTLPSRGWAVYPAGGGDGDEHPKALSLQK